jgi:hypothetical protein
MPIGTPTRSQSWKATPVAATSRAVAGSRVVVDPAHAEKLHAREPGDLRGAREIVWPVREGHRPHAGYARRGGVGLWCSTDEPAEQGRATAGGGWGGKTGDQGEHRAISHAPDTERGRCVPRVERCASTSKGEEAGKVHGAAASSDCRFAAGELLRLAAKGSTGHRWGDLVAERFAGLLSIPRGARKSSGPEHLAASVRAPVAEHASPSRSTTACQLGASWSAFRSLAPCRTCTASLPLDSVRRYTSKIRAVCGNSARTDLCGGCRSPGIPTATLIMHWGVVFGERGQNVTNEADCRKLHVNAVCLVIVTDISSFFASGGWAWGLDSLHFSQHGVGGCRPRLLQAPFSDFVWHRRCIWLRRVSRAGARRLRLRLKLSKNMGGPDRTPCGECGEPFESVDISFPDIRLARGLAEIGASGRA